MTWMISSKPERFQCTNFLTFDKPCNLMSLKGENGLDYKISGIFLFTPLGAKTAYKSTISCANPNALTSTSEEISIETRFRFVQQKLCLLCHSCSTN